MSFFKRLSAGEPAFAAAASTQTAPSTAATRWPAVCMTPAPVAFFEERTPTPKKPTAMNKDLVVTIVFRAPVDQVNMDAALTSLRENGHADVLSVELQERAAPGAAQPED